MAFGNATWEDVTKITCTGYTDQLTGVMEGKVDAAYAATVTPLLEEMAAGPHGLAYIIMPHADKEGWARQFKISPWFVPMAVKGDVANGNEIF